MHGVLLLAEQDSAPPKHASDIMHDEANMLGLALVIIAGTLAEYSAYAA